MEWIKDCNFEISWWIAGGIEGSCIQDLLDQVQPFGIDASSKLEISPGIKDLTKVKELMNAVKNFDIKKNKMSS